MKKKLIYSGTDYTYMQPIFRELVMKTGVKKDENILFSGCPGGCCAMASFLSFGIRDLDINLYFAVDSDIRKIWKLEYVRDLGVIPTKKVEPVKAKVIILMSGLTRIPLQNTLSLIDDALASGGVIIGETVVPGLFETKKWDKQIHFSYTFEFSMVNPSFFEVEG